MTDKCPHGTPLTEDCGKCRAEVERMRTGYVPPARIFSGDYSRDMWAKVNAITDPEALEAVYFVCCRLQEFESYVRGKLGEAS
jgi:hypothetical protein